MEWSEETILRLRALWAEGLSTAEIGRRMGISKNAVVGKAHRLGLPARPSPIRREGVRSGAARAPLPKRPTGPTLPPLATASAAPVEAPPPPAAKPAGAPARAAAPRPVARPAMTGGRLHVCCWPLGDPGTPSFRFCDAEAMGGKPYCAEHAELAYVRVRDRREEAA